MSILTSGIWYGSTEDPWLPPAPVARDWEGAGSAIADAATRIDSTDRQVEWRPGFATPILNSECVPELTYVWYENTTSGLRQEIDDENGIFYSPSPWPFTYNTDLWESNGAYPYFKTYYMDILGLDPSGAKFIASPVCHFGNQILNYWVKRSGNIQSVPAWEDYEIYGRTPYFWQGLDLAQLAWLYTTFYNHTGSKSEDARDWLSYSDLISYSEHCNNGLFDELRFDLWREHGETIQDVLVELVEQSGAWAKFTCSGVSSAQEYKFSLTHPNYPTTVTGLDFDTVDGKNILSFPTMRYEDNYITNKVECTWGSFAVTDFPESQAGDNVVPTRIESPGNLPNSGNVVSIEDADSISTYGEQLTEVECRFVQDPYMANARITNTIPRYGRKLRKLVFSMGPLHYRYQVGSKLPVTISKYGLNGQDFLVTKKTVTLWPFPQAQMELLEWRGDQDKPTLDPLDSSLWEDTLAYFTCESGLGLVGTGGDEVNQWFGASPKIQNVSPPGFAVDYIPASSAYLVDSSYGSDDPPIYTATDATANGYPTMYFSGSGTCVHTNAYSHIFFDAGSNPTDTTSIAHEDYTFFFVIKPESHTTDTQLIFSEPSFYVGSWVDQFLRVGFLGGKYWVGEPDTWISTEDYSTHWHVLTVVLKKGAGECFQWNRKEVYRNLEKLTPGTGVDRYTNSSVGGGYRPGGSIYHTSFGSTLAGTFIGRLSDSANTWPYVGHLAEFGGYKKALMPNELDALIRGLMNKYGITS